MSAKKFFLLIALAVLFKGMLFGYAAFQLPDMKIRVDSPFYLESGRNLVTQGQFGLLEEPGLISPYFYRTPGYPFFLGVTHHLLHIPLDGVIILQILLTIAGAVLVYETALQLHPKIANLAFIIVLFDPSITIYSLMILSESLFLFCITLFMYLAVRYLNEQRFKYLVCSSLTLAAATYIRPISFYLPGFLALFFLCVHGRANLKKSLLHAFVFMAIAHSLLFLWQWRNHQHLRTFMFSSVEHSTLETKGLYKSYATNKDPYSQGLPPVAYYANVSARSLLSLMTRPASFKYFESDMIKKAGKVFSYPWIAFWMAGLLYGIGKIGKDKRLLFLLLVIGYFAGTTVIASMWIADARFRVPMMPFIAILSAYGWKKIRTEK